MPQFLYGRAEWVETRVLTFGNFLIHALQLKLQHFEVSRHICIGKPCICNVFHPCATWGVGLRAYINVMTSTQFIQNLSIGCLLALYVCTVHPAQLCGGFWTILFFCLVCGLLENYTLSRKKFPLLGLWGVVGIVCFIWACRMAQITNFDQETFLIHTLGISYASSCPEICTMTRSPIHFYYRLIRLVPISIYKQCTSHLQALCSNRYHGYGRILNNAHKNPELGTWFGKPKHSFWDTIRGYFEISTLRLYK